MPSSTIPPHTPRSQKGIGTGAGQINAPSRPNQFMTQAPVDAANAAIIRNGSIRHNKPLSRTAMSTNSAHWSTQTQPQAQPHTPPQYWYQQHTSSTNKTTRSRSATRSISRVVSTETEKQVEVVDLCSGSEDEASTPPARQEQQGPAKRVKFNPGPASDQSGIVNVNEHGDVFRGVRWKSTTVGNDMDVDIDMLFEEGGGGGGEEGEEEEEEEGKVQENGENRDDVKNEIEQSDDLAPEAWAPTLELDLSLALAPTRAMTPIGAHAEDHWKGDHDNTPTTLPSIAPATGDDEDITLHLANPSAFFAFTNTKSPSLASTAETIKKQTPRLETHITSTGPKTVTFLGPFVLENSPEADDTIDVNDADSLFLPQDEGDHSISRMTANPRTSTRSSISSDPASPGSSSTSTPAVMRRERATGSGMNANGKLRERHRQREEDRCAEQSRRMREEALEKRGREEKAKKKEEDVFKTKNQMSSSGLVAQTRRVFELDGSKLSGYETVEAPRRLNQIESFDAPISSVRMERPTTNPLDTAQDQRIEKSTTNPSGKSGFDDLFRFSDEPLSLPQPDAIEAQLNFAQRYITTSYDGDDDQFPEDLARRSCKPSDNSIRAAGSAEKTDLDVDSDSRGCANRATRLDDSSPHPERQLLRDEARAIVTSGIERYDLEQAAKERKRKERENGVEKSQIANGERGRLVKVRDERAASTQMRNAIEENEARLLSAKKPLRIAPNTNGGLAQLVQIARERDRKAENSLDIDGRTNGLERFHDAAPSPKDRGDGDPKLDKENWTEDGGPRERKRVTENLMNALIETARCWCIGFDKMNTSSQGHMRSNLDELMENFARHILRGYCPSRKIGKRLTDIKANMATRIARSKGAQPKQEPTRQEIDRMLIKLIGLETFQRARSLLKKVNDEFDEWRKKTEKKSHHSKRARADQDVEYDSDRVAKAAASKMPYKDTKSDLRSNEPDPYGGLSLTKKQRVAWQREDAAIERLKKLQTGFENVAESASAKHVRFADPVSWEEDLTQDQMSESEESDEDEGESAPSFGRGETVNDTDALRSEPEASDKERKSVGGKGVLSQIRKENETAESSLDSTKRLTARKTLPSHQNNVEIVEETESSIPERRALVAVKSLSLPDKQVSSEPVTDQDDLSDIEDGQNEADVLESEADDDSLAEEDIDGTYDGAHVPQYDVVADYDDFDSWPDAQSMQLGRYMDFQAGLRQLMRITSDIIESVKPKYRQVRFIWDNEDYELSSLTVLLPTGGECRIRMVKSWAPITDWPGRRHRSRVQAVPKVFYIVHETKTTSFGSQAARAARADRAGGAGDDDDDDELFGPDDFEDVGAVAERERDMCFSSRQCANEIAKNRLISFINRDVGAEDRDGGDDDVVDDGTDGAGALGGYMEQIEHDRGCFDQCRISWMGNRDGRHGKVEIRVWVEEMIADMPHL